MLAGGLAILHPLRPRSTAQRYTIAIATAGLAVVLRWLLDPVLGHVSFYATMYMAVAFCALVCGLGPAILSALVGFFGIFYWFIDPRDSLVVTKPEIQNVVGFVLVCAVLIVLGEANRRKQLRLNEAHEQLEQRVRERTVELSNALAKVEREVSVRQETEEQLRRLSVHLMTIQDEERRRMARDLHDTAGQTLAAIKMSLAMLRQEESSVPQIDGLMDDLSALTDEALKEIRTTSYLLHPPLLDEAGFGSAARWFVEGFTKRSGIQVSCEMPERVERLPEAVELALFRVLQESLTNIHRHSGATAAAVRFVRDDARIELQVSDNGHGLSAQQLQRVRESDSGTGVGIAGMRERLRGLGGQLMVESDETGMTIAVTLSGAQYSTVKNSSNVSVA